MPVARTELEIRLFVALKRIATHGAPKHLRKRFQGNWGLEPGELLEMAYENIQAEAKDAMRGVRVAKPSTAPVAQSSDAEREGGV